MAAFLKHSFFLEFSPRALSLYDGSMIVQNSSSRQKVSISDSDLDGLKKKPGENLQDWTSISSSEEFCSLLQQLQMCWV